MAVVNPRFSWLTSLLVLFIITSVTGATPNPGHPASAVGTGTITGNITIQGDFRVQNSSTPFFFVNGTSGYVGVNRTDPTYTLDIDGSLRTTGAKSGFLADIGINADSKALSRGDLVSLTFEESNELLPGGNIPLFRVRRTENPSDANVIGVVFSKIHHDRGYTGSSGPQIATGDRMQIATVNAVSFLKASAENGPIVPGDYLTPANTPGHAMKADASSTVIIGRSLQTLASGTDHINAFISISTREGFSNVNNNRLSTAGTIPGSVQSLGIAFDPTQSNLPPPTLEADPLIPVETTPTVTPDELTSLIAQVEALTALNNQLQQELASLQQAMLSDSIQETTSGSNVVRVDDGNIVVTLT